MKSSFGKNVHISLFGESHSEAIGAVIDGLAPGIKLDLEFIQNQLNLRKPKGKISTSRQEDDDFKIVSGYFNGYTTGTPLCILIYNKQQKSGDYEKTKALMRPSHADYTAQQKYLGFQDYRGGGHFSGRITAPVVAVGAICLQVLQQQGVSIGTHIKSCANIQDAEFSTDEKILLKQVNTLNSRYFAVIDQSVENKMISAVEAVHKQCDSVGGILETAIVNMPVGIGEPFFHSLESVLSHLLFSIPAIKGVEFGLGFGFDSTLGSNVNDALYYDEDNSVKTKTNNNGGINGGISNGMPIILRCAVKPTPSIYKKQNTIDINKHANAELEISGRHDPAIIHRARVVVDSMTAIALLDTFCDRFGYMWMVKE